MQQAILVFGGLGDPQGSVVALYKELWEQLKSDYRLIAIDPILNTLPLQERMEALDIAYDACFASLDDFYVSNQNKELIAASFILTPVNSHLMILQQLLTYDLVNSSLLVIEKPSFALHDIMAGFDDLIPKIKAQQGRCYFIDTAIVSPSLSAWLNDAKSQCQPNKIVALACDNPVQILPTLERFRFDSRIQFINQRALLSPTNAGGAGLGLDMGIHAIAGLVRLLTQSSWSHFEANHQIDNVTLQALMEPRLQRQSGAETHLYAQVTLKAESHVPVVIEAGKGGDTWDRRLELYFDDEVVIIGFGTLKHYPYIARYQNAQLTHQCFDTKGSGYSRHFNDIILALEKSTTAPLLSCHESEQVMSQSMHFMAGLFTYVAENANKREGYIEKVTQHQPMYLNAEQHRMRKRLQLFLNEEALIAD